MRIDTIEIDDIWFDSTDRGSLTCLLNFVVDNPLKVDIINTFRQKLEVVGELSDNELAVVNQEYDKYISSCEIIGEED